MAGHQAEHVTLLREEQESFVQWTVSLAAPDEPGHLLVNVHVRQDRTQGRWSSSKVATSLLAPTDALVADLTRDLLGKGGTPAEEPDARGVS